MISAKYCKIGLIKIIIFNLISILSLTKIHIINRKMMGAVNLYCQINPKRLYLNHLHFCPKPQFYIINLIHNFYTMISSDNIKINKNQKLINLIQNKI